jgi:hypothetical protein
MTRLETVLESLPEAIAWPQPSEHMVSRVRAQIETGPMARPHRLRWALAAILIAALVVGVLPDTRQAIADLFREAGVRIGFVEETPSIDPGSLVLGEEASLEEARDLAVDFELAVPTLLGDPDGVFIGEDQSVSMVWLGEAVVLTQLVSGPDYAQKGVGPRTEISPVTVDGESGLWMEGAPHSFTLLGPDGEPIDESTRLAHNVLLWSDDDQVWYRLETTEGLAQALAIAESMEVTE